MKKMEKKPPFKISSSLVKWAGKRELSPGTFLYVIHS